MNKKGFTLIELLAVIVILGIIMLIAVPSISGVITNSRKDAFIRTAESYIDAASKAMISGSVTAPQVGMSTTIKISNLTLENGNHKSPFGESLKTSQSYVRVKNVSTLDKTIYEYYIALSDEGGNCIAETNLNELNRSSVTTNCDITLVDASEPELVEGMIPVTYDETTKNWVKANTSAIWYDYSSQVWANAVTVSETNRESYMNATPGTIVSMDDIQTMWVWIPRYEYQYTNLGTQYAGGIPLQPGEIKINFVGSNITTSSDESTYKVHPAFTFGDKELSGFWYAKFETSSSNSETDINYGGGNTSTLDPYIKPNVTSWRQINVANQITVSKKLTSNNNIYGLSTSADSHVSKNSEWGAVAYLSQSKYGKYGNPNYEGANREIYQNKSEVYITGSSSEKPSQPIRSAQVPYDTPVTGYGASTTGTIYGIYDMSGGANEYVMGNYNNTIGSSELSAMPEGKYYDLYSSTDVYTACNGELCYGHALSETLRWYNDQFSVANSDAPWIYRGGNFSNYSDAGVFCFYKNLGHAIYHISFRLTLAP